MGRANQATQAKRHRERAQQEKQNEKRAKRALRKEQQKKTCPKDGIQDFDPDLEGIIPGPQPREDF